MPNQDGIEISIGLDEMRIYFKNQIFSLDRTENQYTELGWGWNFSTQIFHPHTLPLNAIERELIPQTASNFNLIYTKKKEATKVQKDSRFNGWWRTKTTETR